MYLSGGWHAARTEMQFHRLYCQVMRNTLKAQYVEGFCHCLDTSLRRGGGLKKDLFLLKEA